MTETRKIRKIVDIVVIGSILTGTTVGFWTSMYTPLFSIIPTLYAFWVAIDNLGE